MSSTLANAHPATKVACAHCGLPAPRPDDGTEVAFCCHGCKGAYELIHGWGLDQFYDLQPADHEVAVKADDNSFADLDDPQLMGLSAPKVVSSGNRTLLKSELAVTGLHCAACSWLIERVPEQNNGWIAASVNMHRRTVEIVYDPATTKLSAIASVLARLGYRVAPKVDDRVADAELRENRKSLIDLAIAAFCAANAMWIAVALYAGEFSGIAANHVWFLRVAGVALGLVAVAVPGRVFFRSAIASLRTRTPHMDLPVAIGLLAGSLASVYGLFDAGSEVYFDSMACLVFFLLLGRWIQIRQQRTAGEAVAELTRLTPLAANRINDGGRAERVPIDQVQVGDILMVNPGESLPVDGLVTEGASLIDRSLLTGESRPVEVTVGDLVEAGTDNLKSPLTIRVTLVGEATKIGEIATSVSQAAESRTPVVQMANRIGGWFVVVVVALAVSTAIVWWQNPSEAVANSVSLLIVACPCALALATPLAIALSVGRLARRRVLIRSGECLERLAQPGTIFFDKTGTLTEGRMQVTHWFGDHEALRAAAAIEADVNHPIARALVVFANAQGYAGGVCENVQQHIGHGITGVFNGTEYQIGNRRWLKDEITEHRELQLTIDEIEKACASPIFIIRNGHAVAVAGVSDPLRASAHAVVRDLEDRGWNVVMLSGDHQETAATVGRRLGLTNSSIRGELLPADKLAAIADARNGGPVVMVGDGVNDAAALAAADVGIAVRGGASASLAAAPVMIAGGDLRGILELVGAAKATRRTILRNFAVSLTYNIIAVALAIAGIITPLIAAILMPISSISVIAMTLSSRLPKADAVT